MTTVPAPRALLQASGLSPKSSFGQNFLSDPNLARKIAELATSPPDGTVVEIGAGLGSLTFELARRARKVVAVERDRDLVPVLRRELDARAVANVTVLEADAKQVDYEGLFAGAPRPRVLAGNLPYQLTGPLLERTVTLAPQVDRVVYMVQLEVAARLAASAGESAYGALTVFVKAAFSVERAFVVRRGAFFPQPNVDSAVVVLTPADPRVEETPAFRAVVRAAFAKRRKTLKNAWSGILGLSAADVAAAAANAGIDLGLRGETLDVEAFANMAREIAERAR